MNKLLAPLATIVGKIWACVKKLIDLIKLLLIKVWDRCMRFGSKL